MPEDLTVPIDLLGFPTCRFNEAFFIPTSARSIDEYVKTLRILLSYDRKHLTGSFSSLVDERTTAVIALSLVLV